MQLTDFEYAGETLSAKGCIVCNFDGVGLSTVSIGSDLSFNTTRNNGSFEQRKISHNYEDSYTSEPIQIIKYNCNTRNNEPFCEDDIREFQKWLCRKSYEKMRPIENGAYNGTYFNGFFNVKALIFGSSVLGLELTFNTNAPYGFYDNEPIVTTLAANESINIITTSDEIGYIYPYLKLTILADGDLKITNQEQKSTVVKGCKKNEILTFSGANKIITSSSHSLLPQNFNYFFPRLVTTYSSDLNVLTFSLPCNLELKFDPIRKVGIL